MMIDLREYGITYEGIEFVSNEESHLINIPSHVLDQFIRIIRGVSLKKALLLQIYKNVIQGHKPIHICTFRELSEMLDTEPRALRKFAKQLELENLIKVLKVKDEDKQKNKPSSQYLFTMGTEFHEWLWKSRLCGKIKKQDFVDNYSVKSPKGSAMDPPSNMKGSTTDPQRVHHGPPLKLELLDFINETTKKNLPVFSSPSYQSPPSANSEEENSSFRIKTQEEIITEGWAWAQNFSVVYQIQILQKDWISYVQSLGGNLSKRNIRNVSRDFVRSQRGL